MFDINGSVESKEISRRDLLKHTATASAGLVIAFHLPQFVGFVGGGGAKAFAQGAGPGAPVVYPPNAFIAIAPDNTVTITINKLEMGQGVNTSMAQLIAEELECDWSQIKSISAPVAPVYNHTFMPTQMTGGSTALNSSYLQYRKIGASLRMMLEEAAATRWGVKPKQCHAISGFVVNSSTKAKLSFGDLAVDANKLPLPKDVKLKDPKSFKVIGKSVQRVDAKEKSIGAATYGIDVRLPGMLYAVVARPPLIGAKIESFSDKEAKAVKGVDQVVRFGESVAVLARNTWAAKKGRDALQIKWDFHGLDKPSDDSLMADFKAAVKGPKGASAGKRGDAAAAMTKAVSKVEAEYEFPYLAHACLEPMNCTIAYDGTKAELWAGHQMPTFDRDAAAGILGLSPDKVIVNTVYAGGSFGRRASKTCDYVVEAAQLAKVVKKPLKIFWTREDDMKGGYYRPMNYHKVEVGFDKNNHVLAWNHELVGQSVVGGSPMEKMMVHDGIDPTVCEGVSDTPYQLENFHCDLRLPTPNISTLWWRSVGHTHTAYVMETMIDELSHKMKKDPLALRKEMLKKSPRHLAALDLLAKHAPLGKTPPKGRAYGLAIHESFGTVVAHAVEVSLENGDVKVHRIISAVNCGQVVNPEGSKAQVEGAIVYGLSAALYGEIKIEKGQVMTNNFVDYRLLRLSEMPVIEVYFVPSREPPTGLGEPGLPPVAPAVANALFRLTGKRVRKLPFTKGLQTV